MFSFKPKKIEVVEPKFNQDLEVKEIKYLDKSRENPIITNQ